MPSSRCNPVIDHAVRELCTRRYHGHRHGCPNYGKRWTCPPGAPLFDAIARLPGDHPDSHAVLAIWNRFDLGSHVIRMRRLHPEWSDRQCYCCLYWQGTARKALRAEVYKRLAHLDRPTPWEVTYCPEGMGVNVTATMADIGVELQWPPTTVAYQVALAFCRKD